MKYEADTKIIPDPDALFIKVREGRQARDQILRSWVTPSAPNYLEIGGVRRYPRSADCNNTVNPIAVVETRQRGCRDGPTLERHGNGQGKNHQHTNHPQLSGDGLFPQSRLLISLSAKQVSWNTYQESLPTSRASQASITQTEDSPI
jgi:hypothetical protein